MTLLPRAPRALLRFDEITVQRPGGTVNAEGESSSGRTTIFTGRGTLSSASAQEQLIAQQRGTRIDKGLALESGLDIQPGDFVSAIGAMYEVVTVEPRRLYQRAMLRVVV